MSRLVILVMVAFNVFLVTCIIVLFAQVWQLKEQLDQQRVEQKVFKTAVYSELREINERAERQYEVLYKMVLKNREEAREDAQKVLSLHIDLTDNVVAIKSEHNMDVARLDEKVDVNKKEVNEKMGENQKKVNDSMRGLAELFVNEADKLENKMAKYENESRQIHEKIKQLEAMGREPVMIENKVHVETEYRHHHHQVVEFREPQLTLGERIGQFIGGAVQNGATFLLSKALGIIGL